MPCVPEPDNTRDRYAVKVVAPTIDNLPEDVWDLPTSNDRTAPVRQIQGSVVGHVPHTFCRIIHEGIVAGSIIRVACIFTGTIEQGGIIPGGGPALQVMYTLDVCETDLQRICDPLHAALQHGDIFL